MSTVQDIYHDNNSPTIWNTDASRILNVHILDPASCEAVTHIVSPPPPIGAEEYIKEDLPFFVGDEQVDKYTAFDPVITNSAASVSGNSRSRNPQLSGGVLDAAHPSRTSPASQHQ